MRFETIVRELEAREKERDARRDEERIALEKTVERQRAELACKQYANSEAAVAALKAALLKQGRIRP